MTAKTWGLAVLLATVLANTGCVTCCHKSYQKALQNGAECDLPAPCRNQVYVFLIHGVTPSTECGLGTLRVKLAESGFAKVGVGELASALEIACEVKKIRACEPEARFVFVGYDVGGAAAVCLARELSGKGVPVDGVVLLDPLACKEACGVRTLLITSGNSTSTVAHSERLTVPDASHFKLPAHPVTVAAITELLKDVATHHWEPTGDLVPEWSYEHAPEMQPTTSGKWGEEWDFLSDRPGTAAAIGTRTITRPVGAPAPGPVSTSAGPVVIKR